MPSTETRELGLFTLQRLDNDTWGVEGGLRLDRRELETDWDHEHRELAEIYVDRGLDPALADQVATQMMAKDALAAHARDELGIFDDRGARPIQAAIASAAAARA